MASTTILIARKLEPQRIDNVTITINTFSLFNIQPFFSTPYNNLLEVKHVDKTIFDNTKKRVK
jgi:hypothetical protein